MRKKKKLALHERIRHHVVKHIHEHIHKILHVSAFLHHHIFHSIELIVVTMVALTSFGFANLTGLNQDLYRNDATETAAHLLTAMQNPVASLKQGNIISIWNMSLDIENSFAKWYCTYGAARVSPEFFPFIDEQTQQRTWGGNAVDRCKNASDTWYKIWLTPSQWALIIYEAGGKFWSYGHVGKVMHYNSSLKKIIVRDMARVWKWQMTDRREDITTANVKCYIYNSKTDIPTSDAVFVPVTSTPAILDTTPPPTTNTPTITTNSNPTVTKLVTPTSPLLLKPKYASTEPILAPAVEIPIVHPTAPVIIPVLVPQNSINQKLALTFDGIGDMPAHFLTQNDLSFTLVSRSPLRLGEVATLTLEIKDKKTGELYSGLLPFSFTLLSTNDTIQTDISNIQLINNGSVDISILGQKIGKASVVINIDDVKIWEFNVEVK